jgi:hypothetical protein
MEELVVNIKCGLENESFKYVYGVLNDFKLPFDENKNKSLTCGRNDSAAVQLLLYSEDEMLVCINNDTCFYEKGPIDIVRVEVNVPGLEKDSVKVNLIGLVEDDDRQLKSDIILKQSFIHVSKMKVQPIWIEVEIDKDVKPDLYSANIAVYGHRMFEDEIVIRELAFDIKVLDLELKKPSEYSFYLDLWQHNSNIARKYDVELWSNKHFKIMENYIASLANLGQKAISVVVSEIPWSGQASCYDRIDPANHFEYNIVKIIKGVDGNWQYDFNALNRYVELCIKYGIVEEIEVFGLIRIWQLKDAGFGNVIEDYDDAVRIKYYDESSNVYKYIRKKIDFEKYVAALEKNFTDKGWIEKVRIVADEPEDIELYSKWIGVLKKAAPNFKYKAAIIKTEFIEKEIEGILDYAPVLTSICKEYKKIGEIKDKLKGKMVYYVCCQPEIPNTFISSHLLESRLIPWLAMYMNMDGFLRWNYTVWPNDPLRKISYHYPMFRAGDTNFVYPGRDGEPMLTLRYKLLQKGIRDYEILKLFVDKYGRKEEFDKIMKKIFLWKNIEELHADARRTNAEVFNLNYDDYEKVIEDVMSKIIAGD